MVPFNKTYFELVNKLSIINPSIKFQKVGDRVIVLNTPEKNSTLVYKLDVPKAMFDFVDESVSFYNFPEFFRYVNAFESVELTLEGVLVIVKSGKSVLNYRITSPKAMPRTPRNADFPAPDSVAVITAADMLDLQKKASLVDAEFADVRVVGNMVFVKLINDLNQNSYEVSFDILTSKEDIGNAEFRLHPDVFTKIPAASDYKMSILHGGAVAMSFAKDDINFLAITSKIKNVVTEEK